MTDDFSHQDLLSPETHSGDPWPLYEWLRNEHPVYWDPNSEVWWVSGYDEIVEVAKRTDVFTSALGNVPKTPADPSFINMDGVEHRNRRNLIAGLFTPSAIAKIREHIVEAVDDLLDEVIERGACDFVADIARPLPLKIICKMTGVPEEMTADLADWLDGIAKGGNGPDHVDMDVNEAFINIGGLTFQLVDERREEPKDDLLSLWAHTEVNGALMDDDQILFEHIMILFGGSETARNAISGGVEVLGNYPEQRARLLADPSLIPNAVEESVRWVTPFVRMSRTATQDVEFFGKTIKEGEEVAMLYPPANRDPEKFPDPFTFDVGRKFKNKSLAFGHGKHFCIGAFLARAEGEAVFERMLARIPDWRVAGPTTKQHSSFVRGLTSLPIEFTAGRRRGSMKEAS